MKITVFLLSIFAGSTSAAPAIVWKQNRDASVPTEHSSKLIKAHDLMGGESLAAVFLIGRGQDGSESLSTLTASGKLPGIAEKYNEASVVHHHVAGIASAHSMSQQDGSLLVNVGEFTSKLASLDSKTAKQEIQIDGSGSVQVSKSKSKDLSSASVIVVDVPASTNPKLLDEAVLEAIQHEALDSVILAGIRSTEEVKQERIMEHRRRMKTQEAAGRTIMSSGSRRRLEDNQEEEEEEGYDDDLAGVYYVHMTPNIFAGLLFGLLFTVVTWIGISCMGMIEGQDVYVQKMPSIGREA